MCCLHMHKTSRKRYKKPVTMVSSGRGNIWTESREGKRLHQIQSEFLTM